MTIFELEKLGRILVPKDMAHIFKELIQFGRAHVEERGIDALKAIIIMRGYSYSEIEEICELKGGKFMDIMSGKRKITKLTASKLERLGYPCEIFFNKS